MAWNNRQRQMWDYLVYLSGVTYVHVFFETQSRTSSKPEKERDRHLISNGTVSTYEGRMVPFAPPSGMSLFFKDCVEASP